MFAIKRVVDVAYPWRLIMRRFQCALLAAVAAIGFASVASAADLPTKAPVYKAAPPQGMYNWSGLYLGLYAGGTWGNTDLIYFDTTGPIGQNNPLKPSGFIFGGLAGYNWQMDRWVLGVEGEFGGSTAKQSAIAFTTAFFNEEDKNSWTGRIRGRVGYAFNNVLPFVAGGASFADHKITLMEAGISIPQVSISHDHTGWNIGAGFDYGITNNWIGRVEYIYDRYEQINYGFIALTGDVWSDRRVRPDSSTVRVSIIYKFGG
jgi:outer membrane immunogenic protein